jgi:hypothetical protein
MRSFSGPPTPCLDGDFTSMNRVGNQYNLALARREPPYGEKALTNRVCDADSKGNIRTAFYPIRQIFSPGGCATKGAKRNKAKGTWEQLEPELAV